MISSHVAGALEEGGVDIARPYDYRQLVDEVPAMIWLMDPVTLAITYRNRSSSVFVGEVIEAGDPMDEWEGRIHPDDVEQYVAAVGLSIAAERPLSIKFRSRRADGAYRWVVDQAIPHFEADGSLSCYVGSTLDITEQVEAELALHSREQAELERLRSVLPICAQCKRIRDLEGRWRDVEEYVSAHMSADFSHGLCPVCLALYEEQ